MIGIFLVTHGSLGESLIQCACHVLNTRPVQMAQLGVSVPIVGDFHFNGHKLLLDPYARNIVGTIRWHDALFGYRVGSAQGDLSFDRRDSAPYLPRCKVIESAFTWGDDRRPNVPWHETVIYELHVRGFTRHASAGVAHPGSYLGVVEKLSHLTELGVVVAGDDEALHQRDAQLTRAHKLRIIARRPRHRVREAAGRYSARRLGRAPRHQYRGPAASHQ
mgnify:CR=1 FL=1